MEIVEIPSVKAYKKLVHDIYKNDPLFKDNKTSVIPLICSKTSAFYKLSKQKMIGVNSDGSIKNIAVLIKHNNNENVLYLSFFESKPNAKKEFDFLIAYTRKTALEWGCNKIIAGIDGHCNYSVGYLSSNFESSPAFGQSYHPKFYIDYFLSLKGITERKLSVLKQDLSVFKKREKQLKSIDAYISKSIEIKNKTLSDFDNAIKIFNELNNKIFANHWYYYKRENSEDYELFSPMRPILDSESFMVAYSGDNPIGFLLWYPEYNELVPHGKGAGIPAFLKFKLLKRIPSSLIITEIGVLPEYRNTGLILAMFSRLCEIRDRKYPNFKTGYSGWISQENKSSLDLSSKLFPETCKEYCVYELEV